MLLYWMFLNLLLHTANCFCGDHVLHGKLTEAALQVSDWLRMYHQGNSTPLEPNMVSLALVSLRLAGHRPNTLLSDFKINSSITATDFLKRYVDHHQRKHGNLSMIPTGQMAYIVQGALALCLDPDNFYGHNLAKVLVDGFIKRFHYFNYFQYSAVGLAFCHSKNMVPRWAVKKWIKHFEIAQSNRCTYRSHGIPDTTAMEVMALSCLKKNFNESHWSKKKRLIMLKRLIKIILIHKKDKKSFGNIHSTSLAIQALMAAAAHVKPKHWHCKTEMTSMLEKQDDRGSFGDVLANIQVLPALLGRSFASLSDLSCPHEHSSDPEVERKKKISVCIKLSFRDDKNRGRNIPQVNLTVPYRTTAFEILKRAAEKDEYYKYEVQEFSFGRMITSIANVRQKPESGFYWSVYASETSLAPDGVDKFTPEDKTCVIFRYENEAQCDNKIR